MRATIRCKACGHTVTINDEPRLLVKLGCPQCRTVVETRASEDFSSAVEDAMIQLWHIAQVMDLKLEIDSTKLPEAFTPPEAD